MRLNHTLFVLALAATITTGCSSTGDKDTSSDMAGSGAADGTQTAGLDGGTSTSGYGDDSAMSGTEIQGIDADGNAMGGAFDDPQHPLSKQTIYFMYDSSEVEPNYIAVISAHANYLASHSNQRMILQGHADERGSREYNIALGEQRSKAIARMMEMQGVSPAQIEIVSYGEEKPAINRSDEDAWKLNRRVELLYLAQ